MRLGLSAPYRLLRAGPALAIALPDRAGAVREALHEFGTLFEYARRHPRAQRLEGRGPLYAIPAGGGAAEPWWVVRHCRRGGALACWLDDRYLRVGTPRPVRELHASEELRRRGIATPRIVAAAIYPSGPFYRADVATECIQHAVDLAQLLFAAPASKRGPEGRGVAPDAAGAQRQRKAAGVEAWARGPLGAVTAGEPDGALRVLACRAAGALVWELGERGVVHGDLNAKNILLQRAAQAYRAYLLDLDRCRFVSERSPRARERMWRRLRRSLRKWEARTGRTLAPGEWEVLEREVRRGHGGGPRRADEGRDP